MGKIVRSYTDEYKNTIIELFNSGKTYSELSSEYGIPKTTIRQWVNKDENKKMGLKKVSIILRKCLKEMPFFRRRMKY